jgi:truncated hemoglobin YjbI
MPEAGAIENFGGFAFASGPAPEGAGLFVFTRRIGETLHPLLFGESDGVAAAVGSLREDPALARGLADGLFFMERGNARQRAHILRDLVKRYNPPLNVAGRTGRAAPEIAALVPDRAEADFPEGVAEPVEVSEADLDRLVRVFYGRALEDDVIGPVFRGHVSDWEHHFEIVQNFWSRAFLRTQRYTGGPFAPHLGLNLRPEHFARWVALFRETAEAELKPAAARDAIARVEHMSAAFQAGLFPFDAGARA